jgi:hypothetical protein
MMMIANIPADIVRNSGYSQFVFAVQFFKVASDHLLLSQISGQQIPKRNTLGLTPLGLTG